MHKNNSRRRRVDHISQQARFLTKGELTCSRLALAAEMVGLVHDDRATLPPTLQDRFRRRANTS